jgi:hypothetical protein
MVPHHHARAMARAGRREVRLDARRDGLHALRDGHRPPAPLLRVRRRRRGNAGNGDAGHVGDRRPDVRLRLRSVWTNARTDGDDRDLLAGLARRRHVAVGRAAAAVAGAARAGDGRRVGVGRRARQRDVAAGASQQGRQHHAVRMGDRLHLRRDSRGADSRPPRARRRRLAMAVRRRCPAGLPDALDPAQRARARGVAAAERHTGRARQSVRRDLRAEAARANDAHHPARVRGAVRLLGHLLLAAPASESDRSSGSSPCRSAPTSAT